MRVDSLRILQRCAVLAATSIVLSGCLSGGGGSGENQNRTDEPTSLHSLHRKEEEKADELESHPWRSE